jgi:4-hydroxy-3-polyprenylbenzoate decarboxylase
MDVLDHSCSKLGFGGKMCIDGTRKFDEETLSAGVVDIKAFSDLSVLQEKFKEITSINQRLVREGIPCLIISVRKDRKEQIKNLHELICRTPAMEGIKMILYVEHTVDANNIPVALWRFCNNLDPKRDHHLFQGKSQQNQGLEWSCLGLDGTRKTKEFDDFERDWPNIIVADEATIRSVDEKWDQLGLGVFISSPSLAYSSQMYGNEAVVS